MGYKDKDRQREAQREWVRQKRLKEQGSTQGSTKRGKDIKCFEDLPPDVLQTIGRISDTNEEKQKRTGIAVKYQQTFGAGAYYPHGAVCTGVVTGKPGDADYNGICTEAWRAERGR